MINILKQTLHGIERFFHFEIETPADRTRAEKARLDIITENMREGAILLDEKHRVLFINPVARVMLGLGRDEKDTDSILYAFKKRFTDIEIEHCLENSAPAHPFQVPELESDSEIFQISFSILPEAERRRFGAHALVWIENVTEAKMLERKKSEFVSVVAHQLRTPLSGIKWTLHMLISGDFGAVSNEQKTFLMKTYENNERMIALVNDMLAADRVESGRMKYTLLRINLRDLVENVLFEVFPNAQKRMQKINLECPPEKQFTVLVDSTKIRAVLQNLLENAIKYTMNGGTITIRIEEREASVLVTIADNGIGIPKEQQVQIFSRFFRAGNAVKMEPGGTGLGLYMVKKIIEQHGGTCWFESEEGKGSSFYFTLPMEPTPDAHKKI